VLEDLHVRDLALIEEAWLEFGQGMTVLTGETGAGKTALLGALKLLLGERADSSTVRSGASESVVEGRFTAAGSELVVRRRVSADGRSRCTLDGGLATVSELSERVGPLVDLHGQHEHQALLSSSTHVGYLDRWAGPKVASALASYREARIAYREAVSARDELAAEIARAHTDADYLAFIVQEIDRVDPLSGEDDALRERLPALQNAGRLADSAAEATRLMRGEGGALDTLGEALDELDKQQGIDPALDDIITRLKEVQTLGDDVSTAIRHYGDSVDHDPATLDRAMERLSALVGLTKKYGPTLDTVLERRASAQAALDAAGDGTAALDAADAAVSEAMGLLEERARVLSAARAAAAPGFVAALESAIADLAMEGAAFEVRFSELPFASWADDGPARVDFLYMPASGQDPRPLSKIASGGELSRVMLALKSVLGAADEVETLVFDEVDAGIGGATAIAVGRRLHELSATHQVIVVTHLAQVAAFADHQLVVKKTVDDSGVATRVGPVEGEQRVAEIGRMLSGNDSAASLAHARELLGEAMSMRNGQPTAI